MSLILFFPFIVSFFFIILQCLWEKNDGKYPQDTWQSIPGDIWYNITKRVSLADSVRMRAVSRSWRLLCKENPISSSQFLPWLTLPYDEQHSNDLRFFDLCEGRLYNFGLPTNLQGLWCCGSSKGWLLMLDYPQMFLFNPISGIQLKLPQCHQYDAELTIKIELSSIDVGASNCIVAAAFGGIELALCRPGDKTWIILLKYEDSDGVEIRDIIFSNGELHALISYTGNNNGDFQTRYTSKVGDRDIIINLISIQDPEFEFTHLQDLDWVSVKSTFPSYLVESYGELLIVYTIRELLATAIANGQELQDDDDDVDDDIDLFWHHKTNGFQVFKIDNAISSESLTRIDSLNDHILFVTAASTSLSIPSSNYFNKSEKRDCIYFLDHDFDHLLDQYDLILDRQSGVFDLEDERIVRCFPCMPNSTHFPLSWFVPNI